MCNEKVPWMLKILNGIIDSRTFILKSLIFNLFSFIIFFFSLCTCSTSCAKFHLFSCKGNIIYFFKSNIYISFQFYFSYLKTSHCSFLWVQPLKGNNIGWEKNQYFCIFSQKKLCVWFHWETLHSQFLSRMQITMSL